VPDAFPEFCRDAEQAIVEILAGGEEPLLAWANKRDATWHPNGFVVFELGTRQPGTLRLHIWPSGTRQLRDARAHVHTHVWDLYSRVLAGVYQERMYAAAGDEEDGSQEFRSARINYLQDRNTLVVAPSKHLRPIETITAEAGQSHAVRAGEAHETLIPSEAFVATLLFVSPPRREEAEIYTKMTLPPSDHRRGTLSASDRAALLSGLRAALLGKTNA
jgi:hypothetical protein